MYKSNKKHRNGNKQVFITGDDLIKLPNTTQDLPYVKSIELKNYTPQDFGLDRWRPHFRIPDYLMKKIYKKEVYKDTDLPEQEAEKITPGQRQYLLNYLKRSRGRKDLEEPHINERPIRNLRYRPPKDDIKQTLSEPLRTATNHSHFHKDIDVVFDIDDGENGNDDIEVIQIDSNHNHGERQLVAVSSSDSICDRKLPLPINESSCSTNNIAILRHKIQAEEAIVDIALDKWEKKLSSSDEKRYQRLLKNEEFMRFFNSRVEKYIHPDPT